MRKEKTMKKFVAPELEVEKFNVEDIITTSPGTSPELPDDDF